MIKKSTIQRNLKRYKLSQKYFNKRTILKTRKKYINKLIGFFKIQKSFQSLPKNSNFVRFNRFCFKTGRNKGYYRDFGLSRHIIREMANNCELPGLIKASW